jgi:hypothetical protein
MNTETSLNAAIETTSLDPAALARRIARIERAWIEFLALDYAKQNGDKRAAGEAAYNLQNVIGEMVDLHAALNASKTPEPPR